MEYPGKRKCEVLKDIRRKIAESEGIKYAPAKCNHEGDCPGTCPRCEAEVEYLEKEIARKHGRSFRPAAAAVVGGLLTASMVSSCIGCGPTPLGGEMPPEPLKGDIICPVELVDSSMIGQERSIPVCIEEGDSVRWEDVQVTITEEMLGEDIQSPDSGSVLWQAIEDAKAEFLKQEQKK